MHDLVPSWAGALDILYGKQQVMVAFGAPPARVENDLVAYHKYQAVGESLRNGPGPDAHQLDATMILRSPVGSVR